MTKPERRIELDLPESDLLMIVEVLEESDNIDESDCIEEVRNLRSMIKSLRWSMRPKEEITPQPVRVRRGYERFIIGGKPTSLRKEEETP